MATYRIYRPTYDEADAVAGDRLAARPQSLDGKRIGLLWNAKVNADIYLRRLQEVIAEQHSGVDFVFRSKPTASKPMEPDVLADMAACDLVVTAFGD
jgi:phage gp37-like protein